MRAIFTAALAALICISAGAVLADSEVNEYAYKMMVITDLDYDEQDAAEKRFRFVLPRLAMACPDSPEVGAVADRLVKVHQLLDEAGLGREESLLKLTNTLFGMTNDVHAMGASAGVPIKCAETWAMYISGRQNGMTPEKARSAITSIIRALVSG